MNAARILEAGGNCWRIERARRATMLVDGASYFRALRAAIGQARRSILILGWDIDSRVKLVPETASDKLPVELGPFLDATLRENPGLHAHVLCWDFAMLYSLERQLLPVFRLDWKTHRRFRFRLDGRHPLGASHHQKVVVIDDALAFSGGLDLTKRRWDTPEHRPADPARVDPDGQPYDPFHDIQFMVDGDAAAALVVLARERWSRCTGRQIPAVRRDWGSDPWPPPGAGRHSAICLIPKRWPAASAR